MNKIIFELGHIIAVTRRFDCDMTQAELADKVGVSRNEISKIENLKADPKLTTIMAILDVLGLKFVIVPKADEPR